MMDDLVDADTTPRAWVVTHNREQRAKLMKAFDEINGRWGRHTIFPLGAGMTQGWRLRAALKSQNWTTRLEELPVAKA